MVRASLRPPSAQSRKLTLPQDGGSVVDWTSQSPAGHPPHTSKKHVHPHHLRQHQQPQLALLRLPLPQPQRRTASQMAVEHQQPEANLRRLRLQQKDPLVASPLPPHRHREIAVTRTVERQTEVELLRLRDKAVVEGPALRVGLLML